MGSEAQIQILILTRLCLLGNSAAQFSGLKRKKFLLEEIAIRLERCGGGGGRSRGERGERGWFKDSVHKALMQ